MTQKILFLKGWGLRDDFQLKAIFESKNFTTSTFDLDDDHPASNIPKLQDFQVVFISGALGHSLSDNLSALRTSRIFRNIFSDQSPEKLDGTHFYGLGRGALILLQSEFWCSSGQLSGLKTSEPELNSPWKSLQPGPEFKDQKVWGLQLTERPWDPSSELFHSQNVWLRSSKRDCGWKFANNLFVSDIDFLALKEVSILPQYGYFDSSNVSTASEILDKMVL